MPASGGTALPAVATGHLKSISPPAEGITANLREVKPLVELRVPFELEGALVLTTRGGDSELTVGQDVSIGYSSHTDSVVRLYLPGDIRFPRSDG